MTIHLDCPTKLLQVKLIVIDDINEQKLHTFYGDHARDEAIRKARQYSPYKHKIIETMERVY